MSKKIILALLFLICFYGAVYSASPSLPSNAGPDIVSLEPIKKADRILILAPHPDDETIGCGGVIQAAVAVGADIHIAYLTNGDHNQLSFIIYEKRLTFRTGEFIHMGEIRRKEAIAAMKLLGVEENKLVFLGYPDFGCFSIFKDYWQSKKPFKGFLTRIAKVPYEENLSFGAPYVGESILADLKRVLIQYRPNKIFVSHPADTNVDHKSLYLFMQVALADLSKQLPRPEIYPYLIHCVGWPIPRHYHPELSLIPPKQLLNSQVKWSQYKLPSEHLDKKYKAVLCYRSQTRSSAFYLFSFCRNNELFGDYSEAFPAKEFSGKSNMFTDSGIGAEMPALKKLTGIKGEVSYSIIDDRLLIRIAKNEELDRRFNVLVYLFGYSDTVAFAQMPKVQVLVKHNKFKVFAGKKLLSSEGITSSLTQGEFTLGVPLKILGKPNFILAMVKTFGGILPVDTTGFRKITVK